ncbi:MAG: glycosyltransferase family 2 protein [Acidipila sp.]|nr:glycosyltransferase family 2 protein [Acidipila sp.]
MKDGPAAAIFWVCLGLVVYTYAAYPVILFVLAALTQTSRDLEFLLRRRQRRTGERHHYIPQVAMLVAAHNEERVIVAKLRNTAALEYPAGKFEFLLGLDAPSDASAELVQSVTHPTFRVFHFAERRGKLAVLADLLDRTTADVLVFSDANTNLAPNCLHKLARHFADAKIGAVCGELQVVSADGQPAMESLYWRYEIVLKFLENRLHCVLGANGAVFAVRREVYHPPASAIVEDFLVPMDIRFAGHGVIYDPEAVATEEAAPTPTDEFRRKVRIGTGAFQALVGNPRFLNPLKGLPAFAYFSHKVLRWLAPLLLLTVLACNVILATAGPLYAALLAAQAGFYLLAAFAWMRVRSGRAAGPAGMIFYFVSMNLALLLGMVRFFVSPHTTVWSSTPRSAVPPMETPKGVVRD